MFIPFSNHALAGIDPPLHRFGFFERKVATSAAFQTHPPVPPQQISAIGQLEKVPFSLKILKVKPIEEGNTFG